MDHVTGFPLQVAEEPLPVQVSQFIYKRVPEKWAVGGVIKPEKQDTVKCLNNDLFFTRQRTIPNLYTSVF